LVSALVANCLPIDAPTVVLDIELIAALDPTRSQP
jgi:hypothetical protein